jgi:hypothetical protein
MRMACVGVPLHCGNPANSGVSTTELQAPPIRAEVAAEAEAEAAQGYVKVSLPRGLHVGSTGCRLPTDTVRPVELTIPARS